MRRRNAPLAYAAMLLILLGAASFAPLACSKKEEPKEPTTALEDVQKVGDDAVKSANEMSGTK